jgi:hypothetical protein
VVAFAAAFDAAECAVNWDEFGELFDGEFHGGMEVAVVAAEADAAAVAQAVVQFEKDGAIDHFGDDEVAGLGLDVGHADDVIAGLVLGRHRVAFDLEPTRQLVQSGLMTLRMWARAKKYPVSTVYDAIRGTRKGRRSALIRKDLEAFLNE